MGRSPDGVAMGVSAAAQALAHDPASAPAHRFLSDLYSGEPRLEIGEEIGRAHV